MKRNRGITKLLTILIASAPGLVAAQSAAEIGQAMQANAVALRGYSWKMRTDVKMDGESKKTSLQQLRFDISGNLQKTMLSAPTEPPKGRGIKGKKIAQKMAELQQLGEALSEITMAYLHPNPNQLDSFLKTANVWEGKRGSSGALTRVEGSGLVAPRDSVNIYVNASTKRPTKLEVQSAMNENPVQIVAEYRDLPNGPTYIARVTVDYPEAKLQLIIENFDYVSQR